MSLWSVVAFLGLASFASGQLDQMLFGKGFCPQGIVPGQKWYHTQCRACNCSNGLWACSDCITKKLAFNWATCYVDKAAIIRGTVLCPGDARYKPQKKKIPKVKPFPSKKITWKIKPPAKSKPKITFKIKNKGRKKGK